MEHKTFVETTLAKLFSEEFAVCASPLISTFTKKDKGKEF